LGLSAWEVWGGFAARPFRVWGLPTGEDLKILDQHLPFVFDELQEATLNKHQRVKLNMDRLFA
jgi:hypothetical protein